MANGPDSRAREEVLRVYQLAFETWRFQVNSGWQRSSYFAAFETALLLGTGSLVADKHFALGVAGSVFGILLTLIWWLNDRKVQSYIDYWWGVIAGIERDHFGPEKAETELPKWDLVSRRSDNLREKYRHDPETHCGSYRSLMRAVPALFALSWITLLAWSICGGRP